MPVPTQPPPAPRQGERRSEGSGAEGVRPDDRHDGLARTPRCRLTPWPARPMNNHKLKVFSGRANIPPADRIAPAVADTLGRISVTSCPEGEIRVEIEEVVRGGDFFLVQPTGPPVNDNLMELLVMLDAFKRASAER